MNRFILILNKNYIDGYVDWVNILIFFTLLALPLAVKPIAKLSFKLTMAYIFIVFIVSIMFMSGCPAPIDTGVILTMFLAFPIGYSIYCIRKKKTEKILGIVILSIFSIIVGLVILDNLSLVIKMLKQ